jgi:formate dehydrogenase major subunit
VKDGRITQIEGNPDSPINRARLCPKGAESEALVTSPTRLTTIRYRRPYGTAWEDLPLEQAMDMIADRVIENRSRFWQQADDEGRPLKRAMGMAMLGGATLDNEENYARPAHPGRAVALVFRADRGRETPPLAVPRTGSCC